MNAVLNTIKSRYTCRAFNDKPVEEQHLSAIAHAALASPSAMNRQGWRVIAVRDKALIDEMDEHVMATIAGWEDKGSYNRMMERGGTALYHAPAMIVLLIDEGSWAALDCGIVCQNVALAATSLGVDNCICGFARLAFSGEKGEYFREKLQFPQGFDFGVAVLLGHSDVQGKPHEPDLSKLSFIG